MAHIVAFSSTPRRNGNSDILADRILEGVQAAGGSGEKIRLHGLNIAPCRACEACQKDVDAPCAIDDDMAPLLAKMRAATGFAFAAPIYFFTVCAQMKVFLDRLYALFGGGRFDALNGRKAVVALTYGDPNPLASGAPNAVRMFQDAFEFLGIELCGCVHASCMKAGEVLGNERALAEAVALGRELCGE